MPKIDIERTTVIDVPVGQVYDVLQDFNQWRHWSPWLILEPEVSVKVAEDARYYEWEGQRVGQGNMSITDQQAGRFIDYDLEFLKPFKSKAKVRFELQGQGEATTVTWYMDSSLPFFLFWMKKSMQTFIGMDYERGLTMLKEYLEKGTVNCQIEFKGESDFAGCTYVGIRHSGNTSAIATDMERDFAALTAFFAGRMDVVSAPPLSLYHEFEPVKGNVDYTIAFPVISVPEPLPTGFISGSVPSLRVNTVRLVGSYRYIPNAWAAMNSLGQNKVFKPAKGVPPMEVYVSNPQEVAEHELITDIQFPVG